MTKWRPDLHSLRLFVAVCEEASIARAAEREAIVPSAISKRIAEVEELTGVGLLVRGARGVRPTPAGTALLHHARQILRSTDRLQTELAEYAQGVRGHVRVCANTSALVEFLPRDLSSFLALHPYIRIDLQELVTPRIADAIRDGTAELGICLAMGGLSDLEVIPYASDRLAVVTHISHPLARRKRLKFEDTLDYGFVALSAESGTTLHLSSLAAKLGRTVDYRVYVSTFQAAAHLIAENLAIGILAVDAARTQLASLPVKVIPLDEPWANRELVLCLRNADALPTAARTFYEHLRIQAATRTIQR